MKPIDKDALVAEIERLKKIQLSIFSKGETQENCYDSLTCISVYNELLSFINTLEVKEVDFIKEFYAFSEKHKLMDRDLEFSDIERTASFFFQLGLKAQKGE